MRKIAAVLVMAGCVVAANPASAHGNGGDVVGALVGGALIGAVVGAAVSGPAVYAAPPVYAEPAPVAAPVYAAPVYATAPAPAGCYDQYSGRYVPCAPPPPPPQYGGYGQPGW
ncbi:MULTISPECIES: ecotin precursor [unclassified Paraburkholderia]|uniref:ecotin precursor n=1 Tax=unclassified Paraburkholderia TaxID=2615204 RepID=UPI002AB102B5|nr:MULTISPECIES: ecotin precursor [unclassified Paraburkholderia]